jgi:WD40 repeat protein
VTSESDSLRRWSIGAEGSRIGDPQQIQVPAPGPFRNLAVSRDGRTLAVCASGRVAVLDPLDPSRGQRVFRHRENMLELVSVSPDGRWVGSAGWHGDRLKLWDAQTGKAVQDFEGRRPFGAFSPDGQWLVLGTGPDYSFYEVGTWELRRRLPRDDSGSSAGPLTFSRDGRVLAVCPSPAVITLLDPATGRERVALASPEPYYYSRLCFTPDGSQLAAGTATGLIQLWDLRRLRPQLAQLGLDLDLPVSP